MPRYLNLILRSPEPDLRHEKCLGYRLRSCLPLKGVVEAQERAEAEGITERVMTDFEATKRIGAP